MLTLVHLLYLIVPQLPQLYSGNSGTYFIGLLKQNSMCKVLSTVSDTESGLSQCQLLCFKNMSLSRAPQTQCYTIASVFPTPIPLPRPVPPHPFFREWHHQEVISSSPLQLIMNTCQLALEASPCSSIKGLLSCLHDQSWSSHL